MVDPKAQKILFDTFWGPNGWEFKVPPKADRAYARAAGVMFKRESVAHAAACTRLLNAAAKHTVRSIADLFVSSLGSRDLEFRSSLATYAAARMFEKHRYIDDVTCRGCRICGLGKLTVIDWNTLNFERLKWGGVRHDQVEYMIVDLELLADREATPSRDDIDALKRILEVIRHQDAGSTPTRLAKALSPSLPSNAAERDALVDVLGVTGILRPTDQPSMFECWVTTAEQRRLVNHKSDATSLVTRWRGRDGLCEDAVEFWFGHLL